MTRCACKCWLLFFLCLVGAIHAIAQNLVPNPSFEIYTVCPNGLGNPGALLTPPWYNGNFGTCDYYNSCSNGSADVPNNVFGFQFAHTGEAYSGQYVSTQNSLYREYLQVQLLTPLVAGENYNVSFYISLADLVCASEHIGAYFSQAAPPYVNSEAIILTPQIDANLGFIYNDTDWTLITGCFVAQGGEEWMTIGNFHTVAESPIDPACMLPTPLSYFYVDDVSVTQEPPMGVIVFDLGPPVSVCDDYVIDPGLNNVNYLWEDGSTDPMLHVMETGTYSVTVSQGCSVGIDSLDVNIGGLAPVDIGPDELTICEGDSYDISLNPAWNYVWNDGSTDPDYSITASGTYQVTMDDGCSITEDEITVTVLQPPAPFSFGPDISICPDDELEYDFSEDLSVFNWQDGNTSPTYTIVTGGLYALTITNMCGQSSDDILVTVVEPAFLDLQDNYVLCQGNDLLFSLDPGMGDILWQDGSTDPDYYISNGGDYSVTISNQCGVETEDLFVALIVPPVLALPDTIKVCQAQFPIVLDASNTINATSLLWQDGSMGNTFSVASPGTFSVIASNNCFSVKDSVIVLVEASSPSVILPNDQLLCPGQTFVLHNTGDNGNYIWQDNSTADTLLVSSPGTYSLTINTLCGTGSDTVVIDYLPFISIPDLGPDVSLCAGEQIVLSPNISNVSYLWQDLSTADTLLVNSPGIYYVQVADQCTSASDTIEIFSNNNPPQLSLPAQLNLCQGDSITIDAIISGVSYLWNDNSQASTLTVSSPGTYSLTVSNSCGTDVDTVVVLDLGLAPSVSLGNDIQLCPGDVIALSPVYSDVNTWLWSDGSTADSYSVTGDELVTVEVTNSCGVSFDTLIATLLPATPPIDLGADTSLCPGNTLLLSINTPTVNVEWSDGSVNNQFLVNGPGIYFVTISNSCGENVDTINVGNLPPAPFVNLGINQSLCPGEVITLDPGVTNANYLWQDGSTLSTYNATQAGTIILSVSNVCGSDSDTLEITESNEGPQVNLGPDVTACEGDVITLMSDISGVNYLWQDGSTTSDFTTNTTGTFILQVSNNCGNDADTIQVNLMTAPIAFDLGPDTTICPGESVMLHAPATSSTIKWQDGSSGPTFLADKAQTYSLELSNNCGSTTDELVLSFDDRVPNVKLDSVFSWCPGAELELNVTQLFPATYLWNTGSTSPVLSVETEGHYAVDIQAPCADAHGETDVILSDTCFSIPSFFIPNVFSPNGDNINDVFTVMSGKDIEIKSLHGSIYDRWGNIVFESNTIPFEWTGDFNGVLLNPGVFFYRIELSYTDRAVERSVILSGDVTLIR